MAKPWEKYATQSGPPVDPEYPYKGPQADADLKLKRDQLVDAQEQRRLDREKFEYQKEVDRLAREADAIKSQPGADKSGMYNSVIDQVNRLQELYAQGIGQTSGFGGLQDYLPTSENKRFDAAGAALADQGLAAFKIPGMGSQSDADAERFARANEPAASNRDEVVLEKLRAIRQRLENNMEAAGLPAPQWNYDVNGQPVENEDGEAPPSYDPDEDNIIGLNRGGEQLSAAGGYETVDDPTRKGFNAEYRARLAAGQPAQQLIEWAQGAGITDPKTLQSIQAQAQFRAQNPNVSLDKYNTSGIGQIQRPLSSMEQGVNSFGRSPVGTALMNLGNAGSFGAAEALGGERASLGLRQVNQDNPVSALTGQVGGVITGTGALGKLGGMAAGAVAPRLLGGGTRAAGARSLATDAGYGGLYGGLTEGDPLTGAAYAGAGSLVGRGVASGAGKALKGVTDPALQRLNAAGVPLSIAQMMPNKGIAQRAFNKLESAPLYGDMVATRGAQANQKVYQGALEDSVSPVGGAINAGDDALAQAQGVRGQAYDDALSGVNAPADFQYARDIVGPINAGRSIPGQTGEDFSYALNSQLRPPFGSNRTLDGNGAQQFFQRVKDNSASFRKSGNFGNQASEAFDQIGGATEDLIARTNPGAIDRLKAANTVNARLTPLENAASTANGGVPTPLQMRRAITSNTKKFGGRAAAARGDNVPQIVDDAASILPSRVPNSGTTDRMLAQMVLPAALGGGAIGTNYFTDNPEASALLAALAALSTKSGAKATQATMMRRPEAARRIGGIFGGKYGQMIGSGMGVGGGTLLIPQ